jgi:predicted phage baseplate assembly protein
VSDAAAPLCVLPAQPPAGCCAAPPAPPAAPILPTNAPGLSTIAYRIGTFSTFRREMLERIADPRLLEPLPNPFFLAGWHEGANGDYQTAFVELWAYLADVLTFYQERIANEAYIGTAVQRDSLLRLTALIDYVAKPGAAASALAAFTVAKGKVLAVPPRFRIGAKPQGSKPPPVFETGGGVTASDAHNAIPISSVATIDQFAPGLTTAVGSERVARSIVVQGDALRLAAGDDLLIVEHETPHGAPASDEQPTLRRLTAVAADHQAKTTRLTWIEADGTAYRTDVPVKVYAFRAVAGIFGNNAPAWASLSPTLTTAATAPAAYPTPPYENERWDDSSSAWAYIPIPSSTNNTTTQTDQIMLDATYEHIAGSPDRTSWAVLKAGATVLPVHVTGAQPIVANAYTLTGKSTLLTLAESPAANTFPIRGTAVLLAPEALTLQNDLPDPSDVSGNALLLAGLYPNLRAGQTVVLAGTLAGSQLPGAEPATLASAPSLDTANNLTGVQLTNALTNVYRRAGAVLLANVVAATQGQTIKDEVLGSGDGSPSRSFALKKKPLTYVPASGLTEAAVTSTLQVVVNGVEWSEAPTLFEAAPNAQAFTTSTDDGGTTTIAFGDGTNGARPPTGKDNVHARYRYGMGTAGNVAANGINLLLDSLPGLQKVTNPQPAYGGADPEPADQIRVNAPDHVRSFGRAVSVADYAALARSYPGIAKASASWIGRDASLVAIANPYVQITLATSDGIPLAAQPVLRKNLRSYLDAHRDPNVALRIADFTPVHVGLALTVDVLDHHGRNATLSAVQAALAPGANPDGSFGFFAFERRRFGESIPLSAIYAVAQGVAGVNDVTVTRFVRTGAHHALISAGFLSVLNEIFVRPTEIAVVENDPANAQNGYVTVSLGSGGFDDA